MSRKLVSRLTFALWVSYSMSRKLVALKNMRANFVNILFFFRNSNGVAVTCSYDKLFTDFDFDPMIELSRSGFLQLCSGD